MMLLIFLIILIAYLCVMSLIHGTYFIKGLLVCLFAGLMSLGGWAIAIIFTFAYLHTGKTKVTWLDGNPAYSKVQLRRVRRK